MACMTQANESPYDLSGFDERLAGLNEEERKEADNKILRYLELCLLIAQEADMLTPIPHERTLALSGRSPIQPIARKTDMNIDNTKTNNGQRDLKRCP